MGIYQVIFLVLTIVSVILVNKLVFKFLRDYGAKKSVPRQRVIYLEKFVSTLTLFVALIVVSLIFSIDYKGLLVFASSIFAVVGVALFAQWSILSNVTSSVIIFFVFPAKIGDQIRIVDGDNSVEGEIVEISLFQVEIKDAEQNTILYPNNLLLQKPIVKLNRKRD